MAPSPPPSTLPALELLRGLCSIEILVGHFCLRLKLFVYPWIGALFDWGYESVLLFFLLSGFVISRAQLRKQRDRSDYLKARFLRILPLYLVAVTFSVWTDYLLDPRLRLVDIAGSLLFLQTLPWEDLSIRLYTNVPLWSLSHEMWFYIAFGLILGIQQIRSLVIWAFLGAAANLVFLFHLQPGGMAGHFCFILALSPIWLAGVALSYRPLPFRFSMAQALSFLSLIPLTAVSAWGSETLMAPLSILKACLLFPLFARLAGRNGVGDSQAISAGIWVFLGIVFSGLSWDCSISQHQNVLDNLLRYAISPIVAGLLGKFCETKLCSVKDWPARSLQIILFFGSISYALYIIHSPFINGLGLHFKTNNPIVWLSLAIGIFLTATVMEKWMQPIAVSLFRKTKEATS